MKLAGGKVYRNPLVPGYDTAKTEACYATEAEARAVAAPIDPTDAEACSIEEEQQAEPLLFQFFRDNQEIIFDLGAAGFGALIPRLQALRDQIAVAQLPLCATTVQRLMVDYADAGLAEFQAYAQRPVPATARAKQDTALAKDKIWNDAFLRLLEFGPCDGPACPRPH